MNNSFKLVVFDLDFTLWNAGGVWCDCLRPPFRQRKGRVEDSQGSLVRVYEDVPSALDQLDRLGIDIALASRTEQPGWARELLKLLGLDRRFVWEEIYPSSKLRHFAALHKKSGYDYSEMLFFDDEPRNISEVGGLGVRAELVAQGFRREMLERQLSG